MWAVVAVVALLLLALFLYDNRRRSLFTGMGVPGPQSTFLLGNLADIYKRVLPLQYRQWTRQYGPVFGYYEGGVPVLVTSDVDIIHDVFVKKFTHFHGRKYLPVRPDPDKDQRAHVFSARGMRWKRLRSITNPSFSSGHIKMIMPTLQQCNNVLLQRLLDDSNNGAKPLDVYPYYQEFTLDVIAKIALGEERTLQGAKDNPYLAACRQIFSEPPLHHYGLFVVPELVEWLKPILRLLLRRNSPVQYLHERMSKIVNERRANPQKYAERQDFVNSFLDAMTDDPLDSLSDGPADSKRAIGMNRLEVEKRLTDIEVEFNCVLFIAAGFDTTSNTLAYTSYMLATHPAAQEKVIAELDQCVRRNVDDGDDEIDYEVVDKLTYMECAIKETLRLYPLGTIVVSRQCMSPCTVGGAGGGPSLRVPYEMNVAVDLWSVHRDTKLWGDDAEEFKPERFMPGAPSRHPMSWMPFGGGPRVCLGMRLAMVEAKYALATILRRCTLVKCEQTEEPLTLVGGVITVSPEKVTVSVTPRNGKGGE